MDIQYKDTHTVRLKKNVKFASQTPKPLDYQSLTKILAASNTLAGDGKAISIKFTSSSSSCRRWRVICYEIKDKFVNLTLFNSKLLISRFANSICDAHFIVHLHYSLVSLFHSFTVGL